MSAIIEVHPETAKKVTALAQNKGLSVDELLRAYLPGLANGDFEETKSQAEKVDAFIEWASSHPTDTPLLSEEAVSRKSFYKD